MIYSHSNKSIFTILGAFRVLFIEVSKDVDREEIDQVISVNLLIKINVIIN